MNPYKLNGQIVHFIVAKVTELGYKNIKDFTISGNSLNLNLKNGKTTSIEYIPEGVLTISWSTEDFKEKAAQLEDDNWENMYDETKFQKALEMMIHEHDCDNGITWDTVDYWLDELCRK